MSNYFDHLLLLGRIAALARCYLMLQMVCWSVYDDREPCKTAEPIVIAFRILTPVGPMNHVLDGVQIPTREGAILRDTGHHWTRQSDSEEASTDHWYGADADWVY